MKHFNVDNSACVVAEGEVMRLGTHLHREAGFDFSVYDASGFHFGIVVTGGSKVISLALLRAGRDTNIGLNICFSVADARQLRVALDETIAELEDEAAQQALAALRKAGGRILDIPQTADALSLDAFDRAGRDGAPFPVAPGHSLRDRLARVNARIGSVALVLGIAGAAGILARAAWAVLA